jgi:hypothetical protein
VALKVGLRVEVGERESTDKVVVADGAFAVASAVKVNSGLDSVEVAVYCVPVPVGVSVLIDTVVVMVAPLPRVAVLVGGTGVLVGEMLVLTGVWVIVGVSVIVGDDVGVAAGATVTGTHGDNSDVSPVVRSVAVAVT